jgi:hypothetical protein
MRTGPSRAPSSLDKAISPVHRSRFASWQSGSCWQTDNSTTIAAVEGPLSRLIGEKGKELKTPRAAIPM